MRRRHGADSEFGNMRIGESKPCDAPHPKSGAKPIDEIGKILALSLGNEPMRLLLIETLYGKRGQTHDIEAEAGIERIVLAARAKRRDLFVKKARDHPGIARRAAQPDLDMAHRAINAEQARIERARALAMARQKRLQFACQNEKRRLDILTPDDAFGK